MWCSSQKDGTKKGEFLINKNMQMIPEFYFSPDVELVPLFFAAVSMKCGSFIFY